MALQLIIAGRIALPPHDGTWFFSLEHPPDTQTDEEAEEDSLDEGSFDLWEVDPSDEDPEFLASVEKTAAFVPKSIVVIRPAGWEMSEIAAEVVARAIDGFVYFRGFDSELHVVFDAKGDVRAAATVHGIEERILDARAAASLDGDPRR